MTFNNKKFANKYGAVVKTYRNLPLHFQRAIAFYMAVDGEAWDIPNTNWRNHPYWKTDRHTNKDRDNYDAYLFRRMIRNMPFLITKYGHKKFGMGEIPSDILATEMIKDGWPDPKIKTLDQYREWLLKNMGIENHPIINRWPVILDSDHYGNSVLQDGYTRFSTYWLRGDKTIPVVYYA